MTALLLLIEFCINASRNPRWKLLKNLLYFSYISINFITYIGNGMVSWEILLNKVTTINRYDRIDCLHINIYCGISVNKTLKKCKSFYFHSIIIIFRRRHDYWFIFCCKVKYLETTHRVTYSCFLIWIRNNISAENLWQNLLFVLQNV